MVFFTCIIVVFILYYLQSDGLIFVTIIALVAELINIFLTQTMTKSAENKQKQKYNRIVDVLKKQIKAKDKTIEELKEVQEKSVQVIYKANMKIKEYEQELGVDSEQADEFQVPDETTALKDSLPKEPEAEPAQEKKDSGNGFFDLPSGSNRKPLPGGR